MKYMLDTNTCIYIIKRKPAKVFARFTKCEVGDIGLSSVTLAELHVGVAKSHHVLKNREALEEFILPLEIADFDERAAETYGTVRSYLEKAGTPIGSLDTLIGAHALSIGATLVTNNLREFKRIPKLKVTDWTT